jgi:S1-C subfamily serine protease
MSIANSYKKVKRSIVAFTLKYIPVYEKDQKPPLFPTIIGTGFVIRSDGIVVTNAHVVDAFSKVFRPSDHPKEEWPINVMFFHMTDAGLVEIPLQVLSVAKIGKFGHGKHY